VPAPASGSVRIHVSRDLGLFDVTMAALGAMVGAAIFLLVGAAYAVSGPLVIASLAVAALVAALAGMAYAELASGRPDASGGAYVWVRSALPEPSGFLSGWLSWGGHMAASAIGSLGLGVFLVELVRPSDPFTFFGPNPIEVSLVALVVLGLSAILHFGRIHLPTRAIGRLTLGKILLIVFLAAYLREKRESLAQARLKDVGPLLVIWGGCMLVLASSNDLGSGLLYFGIFVAMLYAATARLSFVFAGVALFIAGGVVAYEKIPHVHERVTIWLQPWTSHKVFCPSTGALALRQDCESYQLVKSLYSIANGGFGGAGLGKGTFTTTDGHQLIPYVNSDFIYSALAQELGLVGAAALLLVFMLFVARGMKIALQADDGFSKLLATGLTFGFALQTFIIVGGVLRIIPLTGITLPFVSYGGSSVVANFLLLAGLLLVSNRANSS